MARILAVDDSEDFLALLRRILGADRYQLLTASSSEEALQRVREIPLDLCLVDLVMPGMDGLELLQRIKELDQELTVIVITGFGSIETAVEAMRRGAYDYLTKPFEPDELMLRVERALERVRLLEERRALQQEQERREGLGLLIGRNPAMVKVCTIIRQVAPTSAPVFITGESGTGKELVARALHHLSPRRGRRLVALNCAALPEALLESELFGHVKGAFTGAIKDKRGLLEEADGGTLFLDEIVEMSPALQVKLLRVLQEKTFRRVGGTEDITVDVRLIAATNRDLKEAIARGMFREDLYWRLNVIPIHLPPLRERKDDIPLLADHFLKKHARSLGKAAPQISAEGFKALIHHDWPGNVRELEHVIERALILGQGRTLTPKDLFPSDLPDLHPPISDGVLPYREARRKALDTFVKTYVVSALQRTRGNVTKAAKESGLKRQSFQQLMRQAGIRSDNYR